MDANLSCGGVSGGAIRIWRHCRGIRGHCQNLVLYLLDPFCGLAFEWPNPEGVKEVTQ